MSLTIFDSTIQSWNPNPLLNSICLFHYYKRISWASNWLRQNSYGWLTKAARQQSEDFLFCLCLFGTHQSPRPPRDAPSKVYQRFGSKLNW